VQLYRARIFGFGSGAYFFFMRKFLDFTAWQTNVRVLDLFFFVMLSVQPLVMKNICIAILNV
jgi:hypothetical protein